MVYVFVRHKVSDLNHWKAVFDGASQMRKAAGELSARMFRSRLDPAELNLLCEWDSLDRAKSFFDRPELKAAMQQAGVVGSPDIEFMEELHVYHRTYAD
jgi:quinol monooxygenase YgiN